MTIRNRIRLGLIALVFCVTIAGVSAASLQMQVTTGSWQAAAGNSGAAFILVYLANPDGTPKVDAQMLAVDPRNPTAGLQLKGTNWTFETISAPAGFQGPGVEQVQPQTFFNPAVNRSVALPGQVRLMQMSPQFRVPTDPRAGIYSFQVLPEYGFPGAAKAVLKWAAGDYHFRVRYKDAVNQGAALGVLVIR